MGKNGESEVPAHPCTKNHEGSSKSMESEAILEMAEECWQKNNFFIKTIISDDDTTMKKILRHNYDKMIQLGLMKKEDKPSKSSGRLDHNVPEPAFLADFNHRVKSVGRALYALAKMKLADSTVNNVIAKRIKLYWSQMLNQIKHLDVEKDWKKIKERVSAPVEHIFDCHKYCDVAWCYSLMAERDKITYVPPPTRPFYNKTRDKKMYLQLLDAVKRFQSKEAITECLHPYNTQKNEAINNVVARYCPKFKHLGITPVLSLRLAIVMAVINEGYEQFYRALINELIEPKHTNSFVCNGINKIHIRKEQNQARKKTVDTIRLRVHGKEAKAAREVLEERYDRTQKLGTYGPSVALEEQIGNNDDDDQPAANQRTKKTVSVCTLCGKRGHKTDRSKQCDQHQRWIDRQQKNKNGKSTSTYHKTVVNTNSGDRQGEEEVSTGAHFMPAVAAAASSQSGPSMKNNFASKNSRNEKSDFDVSLALLELRSDISERKNVKKVKNVGIPVSTDDTTTTPNLFCTFIDEVQKRTTNENILDTTEHIHSEMYVRNQNRTENFDFETTEDTETGKYTVQIHMNNIIWSTIFIFFVLSIPIL